MMNAIGVKIYQALHAMTGKISIMQRADTASFSTWLNRFGMALNHEALVSRETDEMILDS